jgi:hypothetical protein
MFGGFARVHDFLHVAANSANVVAVGSSNDFCALPPNSASFIAKATRIIMEHSSALFDKDEAKHNVARPSG